MFNKQRTIKTSIILDGIGVHSGLNSSIVLKPADINFGIVIESSRFPAQGLKIGEVVPLNAQYATIIKSETWSVSTIEHLMAAIIGLGIDNLLIQIDGFETPILDGSSKLFVEAILRVGIQEQKSEKKFITPKKIISFSEEKHNRFLEIIPAKKDSNSFDKNLYLNYQADFDHPLLRAGIIKGVFSEKFFINELASARTFGFLEQLPALKKNGLAMGASLDNTVVIGESGFLNSPRFEDEFVRHKLLDLIGDLALLGKQIVGTINGKRTGHNFNRLVVEHYLNNPTEWEII